MPTKIIIAIAVSVLGLFYHTLPGDTVSIFM